MKEKHPWDWRKRKPPGYLARIEWLKVNGVECGAPAELNQQKPGLGTRPCKFLVVEGNRCPHHKGVEF